MLLRAFAALFLIPGPAHAAVIRVVVPSPQTGIPALAAPFSPTAATLTPLIPSAPLLTPPPALPAAPLAADREERAATTDALWTELERLPVMREHVAYAKANGLRAVMLPFDGQRLLGLNEDNLAQLEPEDKLVHLNWNMIAPDLRAYERAHLEPSSARRLVALSLAPVVAHELLHARLRSEFGSPFPGVREEELLTHLAQAEAFDEVLRLNPELARLKPLLDRGFLYPHNEKSWERWREGREPLADYVERKYRDTPSLGDDPAMRAAEARALEARWRADPGSVPPVWLSRARQASEFWENPGEVLRLAAFLRDKL